MQVEVEVQYAQAGEAGVPEPEQLRRWVAQVLERLSDTDPRPGPFELSIRVVDEQESAQLNQTYRQRQGPTNVLSFPFELPAGIPPQESTLLGDLVICAPVVRREAQQQNKTLPAHWAHMVVHGTLHLLGYDHQHEAEAQNMEQLETEILAQAGIADPYQAECD